MTFKEMLTFWTISGQLNEVDPGAGTQWKGKRKVKVELDDKHSMYITFGDKELVPISASLYSDFLYNFHLLESVNNKISPAAVLETIKTWIKDLA